MEDRYQERATLRCHATFSPNQRRKLNAKHHELDDKRHKSKSCARRDQTQVQLALLQLAGSQQVDAFNHYSSPRSSSFGSVGQPQPDVNGSQLSRGNMHFYRDFFQHLNTGLCHIIILYSIIRALKSYFMVNKCVIRGAGV